MKDPLQVVIVEDRPVDAELIVHELGRAGFDPQWVRVETEADYRQALSPSVDLILADYSLPEFDAMRALHLVQEIGLDIPFIVVTAPHEERGVECMRKGAADCLVKDRLARLGQAVRQALANRRTRQQKRDTEDALRESEELNKALVKDLQKKNEELEHKNRRLGELYETAHEFVDNVSHEFRTPLTVIKEFTSIMYDGLAGETTSEQKEYLSTVLDRVDDLATMIDDMLDISKLESGLLGIVRKNCSVDEIVNRVRKTIERKAASNRITISVMPLNGLPTVFCDSEKIGRVLINLTVNAIKFSPENGKVSLWAKHEAREGVIRIGVTDHGPGIAGEKLDEIFDRFKQLAGDVRSSTKGFGLGLNIARELVHLNFGEIEVQSEVGKGSTFAFTIPTAEPVKLMERYLSRLDAFRDGSKYVSLIGALMNGPTDGATVDDVERFIQHQIRKNDLVFRTQPGEWLIVVASNQQALSGMIQRIEQARSDANRNRPSRPIPSIALKIQGTWSVREKRGEFLGVFNEAIAAKEAIYV
jgi:signal transduction histidine kinase